MLRLFYINNAKERTMKNKQTNVVILAIAMITVIGFAMSGCASTEPAQAPTPAPVQLHYDLVDGNLTIHEGVTSIKESEWRGKGLTSVTIPNSVTEIRNSAFSSNQLTSVTIPDSVTSIGYGAFSYNQLTSITIGNGVKTIPPGAFANNQLTSITIPDNVTNIGGEEITAGYTGAFANNQLTNLIIGNGVTRIGEKAFANNPLISVTIPDSVASFDKNIFAGARNLTQISIGANVNFTGTERLPFNFEIYYVGNNRQAGIYSFSNNNWNFRSR